MERSRRHGAPITFGTLQLNLFNNRIDNNHSTVYNQEVASTFTVGTLLRTFSTVTNTCKIEVFFVFTNFANVTHYGYNSIVTA